MCKNGELEHKISGKSKILIPKHVLENELFVNDFSLVSDEKHPVT
jgi:hypothetical protein